MISRCADPTLCLFPNSIYQLTQVRRFPMPIFIKTVLRCSICHFTSGFRLPSVLFLWDRIRSETAESRECTASATEEIHSASSSQRRKARSGNSTSRTQVIQTGRFLTLYAELKPKKNFQTKNAAQKEIPVPPSFQTAGVRQKLFYRRSRFAQNPAFRFLIHPHMKSTGRANRYFSVLKIMKREERK